ncbi:MAG: BLUF domain-containing protein [Polaromonas sp.]|nr:BLUF domain-containing protein [Polaromonas sp.]
MKNVSELHEVLYVSTLAPGAPLQVVAQITAKARQANEAADITGLLIFDGMRFCQQIEGPRREVLALIQRILQDKRHIHVEIRRHGPLEARRFKRSALGYAEVEDADVLAHMEHSDPTQALDQFIALLPNLDMSA